MRISDWSSDVCSSDLKSDPNSKIGRAYTAFLDAAAVEAKGLAPIEPWLNKVRAVDKAGLAALLAEADRNGVTHFFGGYVGQDDKNRSEEHTSELQSLMRISYAVFCLKKKTHTQHYPKITNQ